MASSSTPVTARDDQLLAIGKQCSESLCHLVDFLPFKCQHCEQSFCQEHFKVEAHRCPKYDESKHNRVAPNCPLCNTPVAIRPGQDPNVRMEEHFNMECSVMTGKIKAKSTPLCGKATCKKVLFSPIRCDKCRKQFCPSHRFPTDHNCNAPTQNPTPTPFRPSLPSFNGTAASVKNLNAKASVAADAVKKSVASASASASAVTASGSKNSLPFNKTDRRAKAERQSRLKAMQARAKKGLLSEEEKVILARQEAEAKDDKDCLIM